MMKVSQPCELAMAKHFGKKLRYPYLDEHLLECINELDPEELRPRSLDERKSVLKTVATDLGSPILAHRTKKASQYGSNTTELIRDMARSEGLRYNGYIAGIYESLGLRNANLLRDSALDVRMDPILVHDSKIILEKLGLTDSEAIAKFYRKMVKEGNIDFLDDE
jgi:asparagine synthase (glutamine-hydrolysing)